MEKRDDIRGKDMHGGGSHDGPAFEAMFKSQYPPLCMFAAKLVGDDDSARDVVQGVFLKMHERRPVFANDTALRTYMYRSVYNGAMDWIGRRKRFLPFPDGQICAPPIAISIIAS